MQTALSPYTLLLQAYRDGLAIGLFSKDEIVAWADELIMKSDEPDYTLIEISLSKDQNQLAEVLNGAIADYKEALITRVLLGVVYKQFIDENINVPDALFWIELLYSFELSGYEVLQACDLEENVMNYDIKNIKSVYLDVVAYLSLYANFTLANSENWEALNKELIKDVEYRQTMQCRYNPPYVPHIPVPARTAHISLFLVFIVVSLLTFGVLLFTGNITDSSGQSLHIPGVLLIISAISIIRQAINERKANG